MLESGDFHLTKLKSVFYHSFVFIRGNCSDVLLAFGNVNVGPFSHNFL